MPVRAESPPRRLLRLLPGGGRRPLSDEELIAAIERGDQKLGDQLYERLIQTVDHTLYRILGGRDRDHSDLVQNAFEQIVVTLATRRFAKACSLKSWARAVTCKVALGALRSRKSENKVFDRSPEGMSSIPASLDPVDIDERIGTRRAIEVVRAKLSELGPERAEALLLHDMLGCELSEIAVLAGVSVAAAQSRLVRGRHELRDRLAEVWGEGTPDIV
jgi:RNA polymerase sigma-70 factor (ECF subfamily)